jgi:hypothetical protein
MDAIVEAALKKWPNVPHCHGWLALDARGDWYLRDARAQAAGAFPQVKGSRIEHARLRDFIARNYAADDAGNWFFQNGPQRVYVELEAAPWVWRLMPCADDAEGTDGTDGAPLLSTHTGRPATVIATVLDEQGRLFVASALGLGLVHTLDMELAAGAVEQGLWQPEAALFADLPRRFGYCLRPPA